MPPSSPRLLSLDVLRGFDLIWILGADVLVQKIAAHAGSPALTAAAVQLTHVSWDGLRAYDLIFPLFMFLSGVAIPYALDGKIGRGDLTPGEAVMKILRRAALLFLLGLVYNGAFGASTSPIRYASVLGQIGFAYAGAALIHLSTRNAPRARYGALALIVAGISVLQIAVAGTAHLTPENAVNGMLDRALLPGRLYGGDFDPEGLLCLVSSTALTLGGAITGARLRRECASPWKRVALIATAGIACLAAGHVAWAAGYAPVKALWTGSFVMLALGWSLLAFAMAHAVVDLAGIVRQFGALSAIGMNSLALYLGTRLLPVDHASALLFGKLSRLAGTGAPALLIAGELILITLAACALRRRNITLTV